MEAQVSLTVAFRSSAFFGLVSLIFLLTIPHRFSMGFRSGEFAGQSSTVTPWSLNHVYILYVYIYIYIYIYIYVYNNRSFKRSCCTILENDKQAHCFRDGDAVFPSAKFDQKFLLFF